SLRVLLSRAACRRAVPVVERVDDTCRGSGRDEPDGGDAQLPDQYRGNRRERYFPPGHAAGEVQQGGGDEGYHGRAHPLEGGLYVAVVAYVGEVYRNQQDDDERRKDDARHGGEGPPVAGRLVAGEDRGVQRNRSRSRLGQREQFEE